jgi:hypothetical protein
MTKVEAVSDMATTVAWLLVPGSLLLAPRSPKESQLTPFEQAWPMSSRLVIGIIDRDRNGEAVKIQAGWAPLASRFWSLQQGAYLSFPVWGKAKNRFP